MYLNIIDFLRNFFQLILIARCTLDCDLSLSRLKFQRSLGAQIYFAWLVNMMSYLFGSLWTILYYNILLFRSLDHKFPSKFWLANTYLLDICTNVIVFWRLKDMGCCLLTYAYMLRYMCCYYHFLFPFTLFTNIVGKCLGERRFHQSNSHTRRWPF